MSRPTAAQLAYGSATVVCSTVALLLLFPTASGPWVALVGVAALLLGLFVTLAAPVRRARAVSASTGRAPAPTPASAPTPALDTALDSARTGGQPSLRR